MKRHTLMDHFKPMKKQLISESVPVSDSEKVSEDHAQTSNAGSRMVPSSSSERNESAVLDDANNNIDISKYIKEKPNDLLKALTSIWTPSASFKFPVSGKRNLKFQSRWLQKYNWLAYSALMDGAYCKICVLFSSGTGGVGSQKLKSLVSEPFKTWKDAIEKFDDHQKSEYHKTSLIKSENRRSVEAGKSLPVNVLVDEQNSKLIQENKKKIIPIIETILLCGRQGLALRGTKDYGKITEIEPEINDGNFRAILRYRAKVDASLQEHLEKGKKNAQYISNTVQNEIISVCHTLMTGKVTEKVNRSKAFSVLADETADISGIEQVSIGVRYFDAEFFKIREDFLEFVPVTECTGKNLAQTILSCLQNNGIDCTYLVGQGYDGARSMSGDLHGAQTYIREIHEMAIYVHWASHSLNLAVSRACDVPQIRNCLGTIEAVYNFFNTPKRQAALQEEIGTDAKAKKLKQLCPTRWVERHEAVITYIELQPAVMNALEKMKGLKDSQTSSGAFRLLAAISNLEFQVSCQVMQSIHSIILPLSRQLQTEGIELAQALQFAKSAEDEINSMRENVIAIFQTIFKKVTEICDENDIAIKTPRATKRQTHRSNIEMDTTEDYFRVAVFVPFLDTFSVHLKDRFLKHETIFNNFKIIFKPNISRDEEEEGTSKLFHMYQNILECTNECEFAGEVKMWRKYVNTTNSEIHDALDALKICNSSTFPAVHIILKILAVLPVTTCTNERSFSTLKRLKNYLRNSMAENRLNGLASLNIHREILLTPEEVLTEFSKNPRRLIF